MQRIIAMGSIMLEGISIIGVGVTGMFAVAMSAPDVDADKLAGGSGQYVLAVWVLFMIAAIGTLAWVIRFQYKENREHQNLIITQQQENQERFINYMQSAHVERDIREDRYTASVGEMTIALSKFSEALKETNDVAKTCHDKHVMIKEGSCMTLPKN